MDLEQLRNYALSKPGAEETQPFGPDNLVYKINGKMFLLTDFNNFLFLTFASNNEFN